MNSNEETWYSRSMAIADILWAFRLHVADNRANAARFQ